MFWLDGDVPLAAVVVTDWGGFFGCDLLGVGGRTGVPLDIVWPTALELLRATGPGPVEMLIGEEDRALVAAASAAGLRPTDAGDVTNWLDASAPRPAMRPLPDGFALRSRADDRARPHHLALRSGPFVADRLAECPLYDPELDLAVDAPDGSVAAYALFWTDPETGVGLVEPVRTEAGFQRLSEVPRGK